MESFVRRFAQIDSKTPDKTALVCGPERLTYRQLDRYSENLAKLLARNGVGKEQPVGIMVKRCELFPICTLALLQAFWSTCSACNILRIDLRYSCEDIRSPQSK